MGRLGQAAVKELFKDLAYKFEIPFEEKCFEILSDLFNPIEKVVPRGDLDSSGIDIFSWSIDKNDFDNFFQCKGFQVKLFDESQFIQCKKSIDSFISSDKTTENYYLIINRPIADEFITLLENELQKIISKGKAKCAILLDIYKFIDFIYDKQLEIINAEIDKSFQFLYKEFTSVMEQKFYLTEIPFEFNDTLSKNPLKHILSRCNKHFAHDRSHPTEFMKGKYFFVISEFGFGKTSLMFKLYEHLISNSFTPIYLPVSSFSSDGFATSSCFCRDILKVISSSEMNGFTTYNHFQYRVLKNILDNNPRIVLLIDGMDEHKFFKKDINIKTFFNLIREIKAIPIFSLRKEFWEERFGNLSVAIGKARQIQDKLFLTEWDNEAIIDYIDKYLIENKLLKPKEIENLKQLQKIVLVNTYGDYYGDIPKRPLFLEMIIEDVIKNSITRKGLSELYKNYIQKKIIRDRFGSFESTSPDRILPGDWDIYQLTDIIFKIQEYCASKMYSIVNKKIILSNNINSLDIQEVIKKYEFSSILDVLLHSVLVTTEARKGENLQLKFAHFSFLEYFFALHVTNCIENEPIWFSYIYEESTKNFIIEILEFNKKDVYIKFFENNITDKC